MHLTRGMILAGVGVFTAGATGGIVMTNSLRADLHAHPDRGWTPELRHGILQNPGMGATLGLVLGGGIAVTGMLLCKGRSRTALLWSGPLVAVAGAGILAGNIFNMATTPD